MLKIFFLFILFICTVFIDLPLSHEIGTIGKSLMIFFAPIVGFIIIYYKPSIIKQKDVKLFFEYYFISIAISSCILFFYILIAGNVFDIYNKFMFLKLIFASTYILIFGFAYLSYRYIFIYINIKKIRIFFQFVFIFLSAVGLIELFNRHLFTAMYLHSINVYYYRLRLLTSEPSQAFLLYGIFALLAIISSSSKLIRILFVFIFLFFSVLIGSKGGLILISFSLFILILFNLKRFLNLKNIILLIIIIIACFYFFNIAFHSTIEGIQYKFTSFTTRSAWIIATLISLIFFPIGEGYGTYLSFIGSILKKSCIILKNLVPFPLAFSEVHNEILYGLNLGAKAGIQNQIIYNGWIAIIFYFILFTNAYKKIKYLNFNYFEKFLLKLLLIFIFLEIFLVVNTAVMYAYIIPIALINSLYQNKFSRNNNMNLNNVD